MSALTNPSSVPIHSVYIGRSFCTTSATTTVRGGGAFGADLTVEQPIAVSNTATLNSAVTALARGLAATADSPIISKRFMVDSSMESILAAVYAAGPPFVSR